MKYLSQTVLGRYKAFFTQKHLFAAYVTSIAALCVSLFVNYFANIYAMNRVSNSVTDIILSNIRVFNVDGIFVYGPLVFWLCTIVFLLMHPNKFPFTIKSIALFILIRSIFITLTHIGPFPMQATTIEDSDIIRYFTSGGDLFFSAHTGLPFLMALVFWNIKPARIVFLCTAVFFGIIVLLGHFHYSIDVLSAFFITYTIFCIAKKIFKKDHGIFNL